MIPTDPYHELRWWVTEANLPVPADMLPALTALLAERDTLAAANEALREEVRTWKRLGSPPPKRDTVDVRVKHDDGSVTIYEVQRALPTDAEVALFDGLTP